MCKPSFFMASLASLLPSTLMASPGLVNLMRIGLAVFCSGLLVGLFLPSLCALSQCSLFQLPCGMYLFNMVVTFPSQSSHPAPVCSVTPCSLMLFFLELLSTLSSWASSLSLLFLSMFSCVSKCVSLLLISRCASFCFVWRFWMSSLFFSTSVCMILMSFLCPLVYACCSLPW